jgi:hypothetical protein
LDNISIQDAYPMLLAATDANPAHPAMSIFFTGELSSARRIDWRQSATFYQWNATNVAVGLTPSGRTMLVPATPARLVRP